MLSLDRRPAMIGTKIIINKSSASKKGQGEMLTGLEIPLEGIMLNERELNALMCNPLAYQRLFEGKTGAIIQPAFDNIGSLRLTGKTAKFESATVELTFGVDAEVLRCAPCRISKIKLDPASGGLTEMSCLVTCTPDMNAKTAHLQTHLEGTVEVAIYFGGTAADQQDLPLNSAGAGEQSTPSVGANESMDTGLDQYPLYEEAKKIVISTNVASTSILETQLKISHTHAERLLERMESEVVVSPKDEEGARRVSTNAIPQEWLDKAAAQQAGANESQDDDDDSDDEDADDEQDDAA